MLLLEVPELVDDWLESGFCSGVRVGSEAELSVLLADADAAACSPRVR
jgi:hypothetical protein